MAVSPDLFAEHLEVLRSRYCPAPLSATTASRGIERVVAVTFDNGYADNLTNAMRILEKYEISATVFVITGNMNSGEEYVWDSLGQLLFDGAELPPALALKVRGEKVAYSFDKTVDEDADGRCLKSKEELSTRHAAYQDILGRLLAMPLTKRTEALQMLFDQAGRSRQTRELYRPLSADEVIELDRHQLMSIGSRSVSCACLAGLKEKERHVEVGASKRRLEELLCHPINSFSYPGGGLQDGCAPETVSLVAEYGYRIACTGTPGLVDRGVNRLLLPRVFPSNCDGDTFAKVLDDWFEC